MALKLLFAAAELVAQGELPKAVQDAMRLSQLTAILRESGRVRCISAEDTLRRLVGKCLARQFAEQLRQAAGPANFGMSTKCGTDGLVHLARALFEFDPEQTILCIDGVGAFDHVSRARMFERLLATPSLRPVLPFVRLWYSSPSEAVLGRRRRVHACCVQCRGRGTRGCSHAGALLHRPCPRPRANSEPACARRPCSGLP